MFSRPDASQNDTVTITDKQTKKNCNMYLTRFMTCQNDLFACGPGLDLILVLSFLVSLSSLSLLAGVQVNLYARVVK